MVSQYKPFFFSSILSFPTKANEFKTLNKRLIIIYFKVLDYCSDLCYFVVPIGCPLTAKEFDYLSGCKVKKCRTKSMGYCCYVITPKLKMNMLIMPSVSIPTDLFLK